MEGEISVCITTYNRPAETIRAFEQVYADDRINDIVIVDDKSAPSNKIALKQLVSKADKQDKIFLWFNPQNMGCYRNKFNAVQHARNKYVILFDSDNILTPAYVDKLYTLNWSEASAFLPSFAKPFFDYRHLTGTYTRKNIGALLCKSNAFTLLNTMNFFVNRTDFEEAYNPAIEPLNADSLYYNYRLLAAGKTLSVVPGLEYEHTVHDGSHFKQYQRQGRNILATVENKIRGLARSKF